MPPKKQQKPQKPKAAPRGGGATAPKRRRNRAPKVSREGKAITLSGEDFVGDIVVDSTVADGAVLMTVPVHPPAWNGSHAASLLTSFERYRLLALKFMVSSRASSVVGGGYLAGVSTDATRGLAGAEGGRAAKLRVRALAGSTSAPLVSSSTVVLPSGNNTSVWRYSDASRDIDIATYGYFFLVLDGKPAFMTGLTQVSLSVQVSWRMQLASPTVGATVASGVHSAKVPANNQLKKAAEYNRAGDPYHPYNQAWVDAANRFTFGSIIAVSPPVQCESAGDGKFARLSWHSQRDQLRFCFFDTYAKAEANPEPGPSNVNPLQFTTDPVTSSVDIYLHEVGYKEASKEEREARLAADFHWALTGPRALRSALLTRDEAALAVQRESAKLLKKVQDRLVAVERTLSGQASGTYLDPVKVVVEAPVPLPVVPGVLPVRDEAGPSGRVEEMAAELAGDDYSDCEPTPPGESFYERMLERARHLRISSPPSPRARRSSSLTSSLEVLSLPED